MANIFFQIEQSFQTFANKKKTQKKNPYNKAEIVQTTTTKREQTHKQTNINRNTLIKKALKYITRNQKEEGIRTKKKRRRREETLEFSLFDRGRRST